MAFCIENCHLILSLATFLPIVEEITAEILLGCDALLWIVLVFPFGIYFYFYGHKKSSFCTSLDFQENSFPSSPLCTLTGFCTLRFSSSVLSGHFIFVFLKKNYVPDRKVQRSRSLLIVSFPSLLLSNKISRTKNLIRSLSRSFPSSRNQVSLIHTKNLPLSHLCHGFFITNPVTPIENMHHGVGLRRKSILRSVWCGYQGMYDFFLNPMGFCFYFSFYCFSLQYLYVLIYTFAFWVLLDSI